MLKIKQYQCRPYQNHNDKQLIQARGTLHHVAEIPMASTVIL
jgi:hypothetical protein